MGNNKSQSGLGLLLVIGIAVLGYFMFFGGTTDAQVIGGELAYVEGAVEYKTGDGDWTRAADGQVLAEGDSVEVVGDGRAIVNLDDGSVLRLNDDSTVTLTSLDPKNMVVTLDSGDVYSRVVKSSRTFEISAADAIYQAVGTAYRTFNYEDKKGVEVYQSTVKVKAGEDDWIKVEEGKKYFVKTESPDYEKKLLDVNEDDLGDEFLTWNKDKDSEAYEDELGIFREPEEEEVEKEVKEPAPVVTKPKEPVYEKPKEPTSGVSSIALKTNGTTVYWTATGYSSQGYKVVWSKSPNPTYPTRSGDKYKYLSDPKASSASLEAFDGPGMYYVRVCEYLGGACGVYSNQVTIQFDEVTPPAGVNSLSLWSNGGNSVGWSVDGYSPKGYKVVWSKTSGPTYPTRSGDKYLYFSNPNTLSTAIKPFDGAGTYYVRVCEYLGSACGVYSNQIQVEL